MDSIMIAVYVGKCLEDHRVVTPKDVQSSIFQDRNVEKIVCIDDIIFVMNLLVEGSFLEQVSYMGCGVYKKLLKGKSHSRSNANFTPAQRSFSPDSPETFDNAQ